MIRCDDGTGYRAFESDTRYQLNADVAREEEKKAPNERERDRK